jgi:hypothetical protein
MATYYVWSGATGSGSGADWANAVTSLVTMFATDVAGDTIYVAHDHAETTGTGTKLLQVDGTIAVPTSVLCVNRAGSVPPVYADRRATAQITTPSGDIFLASGYQFWDGFVFIAGSGSTAAGIRTSGSAVRIDNCTININNTNASSRVAFGGNGGWTEVNNCTVQFGDVNQQVVPNGTVRIRNTVTPFLVGSVVPTKMFVSGGAGVFTLHGLDLSNIGSGKTLCDPTNLGSMTDFRFIDCKIDTAVTKMTVPNNIGAGGATFMRSHSSGNNYTLSTVNAMGALDEETTIIRTGGASDGTVGIAWKITTSAVNNSFLVPFESPPIAVWNTVVGSVVTATVEGVWGGGSLPTDAEIWLEVEYIGSTTQNQGRTVNDARSHVLVAAANQASSSATWGGSTTKFKLGVTFTPQRAGWVTGKVKVGKPASTFYVDPMIVLT